MLNLTRKSQPSPWKGVVAGVCGGLAGTIAMTQFQNVWKRLARRQEDGRKTSARNNSQSQPPEEKEDATMKVAGKMAEMAGHELTHSQKRKAGPVIHYGFGTSMGVVYGVLREVRPRARRRLHPVLAGASYGTILFLGADELIVPALELSSNPKEASASTHVYGLIAHAIYGVTGEMVRSLVRGRL